jgi:hypothetical protein
MPRSICHVPYDVFHTTCFVQCAFIYSPRRLWTFSNAAVEPTFPSTLYARILKGGAIVFVLLGGGMIAWSWDQWIKHPEVQASQFGNAAPFWPAVIVFILISMVAGVTLLWRAASRLEDGENLFEERHRKSLKDFEEDTDS